MSRSDCFKLKFDILELLRIVKVTIRVIESLEQPEHDKLIDELITIQENRCDDILEKIEKETGRFKMECEMITGMVKLIKSQISGQRYAVKGVNHGTINEEGFEAMLSDMVQG